MKYYIIFIIIFIFACPALALANDLPDRDRDGVPDKDEQEVYFTNPDNPDTDNDGYNDWVELNNGYSPYSGDHAKLEDTDSDGDGLSDKMEIAFHSSPLNADTDGDGYQDREEIKKGYNPAKGGGAELERKIFIDKKNQLLSYNLGGVSLGIFPVSTGRPGLETFSGSFQVLEKDLRRWSSGAKLWMPFWMMFNWQGQGIHELPEWDDGTKEGENHLGIPVSHGCVRLGIGPAEELYNFAKIGTKVYVN
ncbi:MAG: hypothetical protein AUJ72_00080 [Candidatus Omnitrophica bacterium CG1_02_46_14]|nr:MAG: hypothetical protein AUJ72_00080 [Candidatus Omnitrophica bacterium CG1_02_46_14]